MIFLGLNQGLLLIALGMGYVVLYLAKREERYFRTLGFCIGAILIILSIMFMSKDFFLGYSLNLNRKMIPHIMQPRIPPQVPTPTTP